MISAAALRERKKNLDRQKTRETTILGKVIEDGEDQDETNALPYDSVPRSGEGDLSLEVALEGDEDESELLRKARWMTQRGNGYSVGKGKSVGVFVLAKEKHERHYDQIAFLLSRHFLVKQIDSKAIETGKMSTFE